MERKIIEECGKTGNAITHGAHFACDYIKRSIEEQSETRNWEMWLRCVSRRDARCDNSHLH